MEVKFREEEENKSGFANRDPLFLSLSLTINSTNLSIDIKKHIYIYVKDRLLKKITIASNSFDLIEFVF